MRRIGRTRAMLVVALVAWTGLFGEAALASADPAPPTSPPSGGSALDHVEEINARQLTMYVYSAAMDKVIPLEVIRPADTSAPPRPTLYLSMAPAEARTRRRGRHGQTSSTSSATRTSTSSTRSAVPTATTPTGRSPILFSD